MENQFTKYHFDGQKADEQILSVLHRHWFDILSQFIIILAMLAFLFGSYAFPFFLYDTLTGPFSRLASFLRNLFFLLTWMTFFVIWIDYYLDVWIITDRRIINIEQKGLFSRVVSELQLEKIQDVTTEVKSIIPTFLNYGDLFVQTAGKDVRFLFHNIPDPYAVKDLIMQLQKKYERREETEFSEMLKKKILE